MLRMVAIAAALALCAGEARATGGFWCTVEDANLKFSAESAFSHGLGARFLNFKAEAEVKVPGTPEALRKLSLDDALIHSWFHGPQLKLLLYRETEGDVAHGYVEIIIETNSPSNDDSDYSGTYKLIVYTLEDKAVPEGKDMIFEGEATCSVG